MMTDEAVRVAAELGEGLGDPVRRFASTAPSPAACITSPFHWRIRTPRGACPPCQAVVQPIAARPPADLFGERLMRWTEAMESQAKTSKHSFIVRRMQRDSAGRVRFPAEGHRDLAARAEHALNANGPEVVPPRGGRSILLGASMYPVDRRTLRARESAESMSSLCSVRSAVC